MSDGHEQATVHAEVSPVLKLIPNVVLRTQQNAIAHAARTGIALAGATAYITHYPCINCFKALVAAGIIHVFYIDDYRNDPVVNELSAVSKVPINKLS